MNDNKQKCPLCRGEGYYFGPKSEKPRSRFEALLMNVLMSMFIALASAAGVMFVFGPGDGTTIGAGWLFGTTFFLLCSLSIVNATGGFDP